MKKVLITAVFVFISAYIFAQERIAVFPFEDMDNVLTRTEKVLFYSDFSNEFSNRYANKFSVVPRMDVERLINIEMDFQLTNFSAQEKTAEMNRVLNGTRILTGYIGMQGRNIRIVVSLYTYPELVQLPGGTSLSVANKDELFRRIPELVQRMQITVEPPVQRPSTQIQPSPRHPPPNPPEVAPVISFFWDMGGGSIFGFIAPEIGLQLGIAPDSDSKDNYFNFLLDIAGGMAMDFFQNPTNIGFAYNLGAVIEYRFADVTTFGVGGGMGGLNDNIFPYIKVTASFYYSNGAYKIGLYFDYNFDYSFKFGFRWHLDFTRL